MARQKKILIRQKLLFLLSVIPFLAIGQSQLSSTITQEPPNSRDRTIEATLINDLKRENPIVVFKPVKSVALSTKTKDLKLFQFIDEQEMDTLFLRIKPLTNVKQPFKKTIETKDLFEN